MILALLPSVTMLKTLSIRDFTAFSEAELQFSPGLNVVVSENGLGKTHLLKLAYSVLAVSAEEGRRKSGIEPTKALLQARIAEKLVNVMRPESLGRLARRRQGLSRAQVGLEFNEPRLNTRFSFATQSKSEVRLETVPKAWLDKAPVFLPTRELLTIFPGFVSVYDSHYLEFEETWRDTCLLLGVPALKGPREKTIAGLVAPLEEAMGGRVVLDRNGRFYLQLPGTGNMEMHLVAEGLRKVAMLARLIATGSLLGQGYLFWDEPETNLNPRLIRRVARAIMSVAKEGVQVFVASHSLFLLRELEMLKTDSEFSDVPQRFFALSQTVNGVAVEQADDLCDIDPIVSLDEELAQSARFMDTEE